MTTHRLALTAALASLFFISVPLFASETDDRIETSAKQSYVFKTYLKGDDIQCPVQGWRCHLDRGCFRGILQKIGRRDRCEPARSCKRQQQVGRKR